MKYHTDAVHGGLKPHKCIDCDTTNFTTKGSQNEMHKIYPFEGIALTILNHKIIHNVGTN